MKRIRYFQWHLYISKVFLEVLGDILTSYFREVEVWNKP